ncbi:hypothetical protein [Streptomyces violarus]|uniref:hypothetical protein n=1 Tax=Streptomyces violarus TaxID=67380 RepID=UPI0021BFA4E8|nr:hypothetical protein [Streptomyces violarus]MCT9140338.1 hypothetical protein [Streptomyces violarus]
MIETPAPTHRTPAQIRRRRALHNAAAGHTAVVLYVCTHDDRVTPADAVAALRRYAIARDWLIAEVILDYSNLETPLDGREQWTIVRQTITDRRAEGVVTVQGHIGDDSTPERDTLLQWLADQGAFLSIAHIASGTPRPERASA